MEPQTVPVQHHATVKRTFLATLRKFFSGPIEYVEMMKEELDKDPNVFLALKNVHERSLIKIRENSKTYKIEMLTAELKKALDESARVQAENELIKKENKILRDLQGTSEKTAEKNNTFELLMKVAEQRDVLQKENTSLKYQICRNEAEKPDWKQFAAKVNTMLHQDHRRLVGELTRLRSEKSKLNEKIEKSKLGSENYLKALKLKLAKTEYDYSDRVQLVSENDQLSNSFATIVTKIIMNDD